MAALADYNDLIARYDVRTVADLVSDTGKPEHDLANNAAVTAALESGTVRLEAAATVSNLYTPAELAALTDNSLALAKDLVCAWAIVSLARRRFNKANSDFIARLAEETEAYFDRLRKGERLFAVTDDPRAAAGLPTIDGPSVVTYDTLQQLREQVPNFYVPRGHTLPLGR